MSTKLRTTFAGLPTVAHAPVGRERGQHGDQFGVEPLVVPLAIVVFPCTANVLQQRARFDDFVTRYNTDRPHQALGMKVAADLYTHSSRLYSGLEDAVVPWEQMVAEHHCGFWAQLGY